MYMSNNNNARYKESREMRDPNANTRICFEVRATALRLRLHTEGFSLCPPRTFHKGTSTEEFTTYKQYTTLTLSYLYTRG